MKPKKMNEETKKSAKSRVSRFLANMNAALRGEYKKLKKWFGDHRTRDAESTYRMALLAHRVRSEKKKYGTKAIVQLAAALGIDKTTLYRWADVARVFPHNEFRALLARKNRNGLPMSWCHFEVLARVKDTATRERLAEAILAKGLSVIELRALVGGSATASEEKTVSQKSSGAVAAIAQGTVTLGAALECIAHLPHVEPDDEVAKQLTSLRALCEKTARQIGELLGMKNAPETTAPAPDAPERSPAAAA